MAEERKDPLSKIQSSDSIWSRDSEDESFLRDRTEENMAMNQVNKSLENILLDTTEVSSVCSKDEISLSSQILEGDFQTNLNNNSAGLRDECAGVGDKEDLISSNNEETNISKDGEEPIMAVSRDEPFTINPDVFNSQQSGPLESLGCKHREDPTVTTDTPQSTTQVVGAFSHPVQESQDGTEHLRVKHMSTSESVVEVCFEEEKSNLPTSTSSKSLLKFFNDSPASKLTTKNIDEDGKNFFDSFAISPKADDVISDSNVTHLLPDTDTTHTRHPPPSHPSLHDDLSKVTTTPSSLVQPSFQASPLQQSPIHPTTTQTPSSTSYPPTTLTPPFSSLTTIPNTTPYSSPITTTMSISTTTIPISTTTTTIPTIPLIPPTTTTTSPNLPDRSYDAWLPTKETATTLSTLLTISPTMPVPVHQLTLPGIIHHQPLTDPVGELMSRYSEGGECGGRVMRCSDVPQDLQGVLSLIHAGSLRSAVELTTILLTACGQGVGKVDQLTTHSPYSLQLWFCRFSLLHRLGLHTIASDEWKAFGNLDTPDLYYQFNPAKHPGRKGSMLPFHMRTLLAQHLRCTGSLQASLQTLCAILAVVKKIQLNLSRGLFEDGEEQTGEKRMSEEESKESSMLWQKRCVSVLYCMADCLYHMKDYYNSIRTYKRLLRIDPPMHHHLHLTLACIYMQAGDIDNAEKHFLMTSPHNEAQTSMNKALLDMAKGRFIEAHVELKKIADEDKNNITAQCNSSVCTLYTGRLKESLKRVEVLIFTHPALYLQEILVLNLCTLYELESSKAALKKQVLLRTLATNHPHHPFNPSCLKLT